MYTVSEITTFDEEKQLYETHIGLTPADFKIERTPNCIAYDDVEMVLLLSAWGKSEQESRLCAMGMVKRMEGMFEELPKKKHRQYPLTRNEMMHPDEPPKR